jgi:2-oxoglutarate ferredoxin oxidoreductase subunit delta
MARVEIDEELCKGCELCTVSCPRHLLAIGSHFNTKGYRPVVFLATGQSSAEEPDQPAGDAPGNSKSKTTCNACTLCARMCPDVAITVYK